MQIIPKENLEDFKLPLPIYKTIHIADAVSRDGEEFLVMVGMDENIVSELKKKSLDDSDVDIQQNTSDRKRFGEEQYDEWYSKKRTPFVLVHKRTNALAAIVWFGPKPAHDGCKCHATAWRSYAPFRGKGIMKKFTQFAIDFYLLKIPNTNFWAEIKPENSGSLTLAESLGFVVDKKLSDNYSTILGKKVVPYNHE